ncbi:pre-mRNA splicing regulator USH1G [Rhipicephalus microplus]|uniref:pre-mRNA splicing regulator USH1G n=1 Tax=Rhipicephalus microplus TaxID=6941 RepID=UPI003F6C4207
MDRDRFHRAARDGYLDLLREATRKDCNTPDEDGMTPTIWSAYYGHLDALRLLVGRGGDPDRCDHYGSTALHCAAANGHINCVSFLVSFGVNLWALDNDFHTATDVASINQREEVLRFLDQAVSKQSALNKKLVQRLKEKALRDADKRRKGYQKLTRKAAKKAERDDKMLEKQRKRMAQVELLVEANNGVHSALIPLHVGDGRGTLQPTRAPKFSDMVSTGTSTTVSSRKGLGAVSKKVHLRKQNTDPGEFNKVRTLDNDGKKSIRSLTGLQRDAEVVFVPKGTAEEPLLSPASRPGLPDFLKDGSALGDLSRAISEPDLGAHPDSGLGEDEPTTGSSMFERPGFGSVAFRNSISGTLLSLPSCRIDDEEVGSIALPCGSVVDSIGSAGSLAQRQSVLPWEDVEDVYYEEDEEDEEEDGGGTPPAIVVFLAAHGLAEYVDLFSREKVDLDALTLLGEEDLKTMGVPLGPRKKLLRAVEQRRVAFEDPGEVADSRL